ncbi:MAG: HD domain-containing protein [Gemmatimonadota bacterium]|nr:HD domain-containing protein [Gemmatimonadota bacterium]
MTTATTIRGIPRPLARALERTPTAWTSTISEAYDLAWSARGSEARVRRGLRQAHDRGGDDPGEAPLDTASIVAGLIHDVVEDTEFSLADVEERFGGRWPRSSTASPRSGKVQFRSQTERQAENYRKLLLSMAEDARVILIKLADRLHNMRTLEHLPRQKQQRIALETREIYAPLAHRLGMAQVSGSSRTSAFKFLEPDAYDELRRLVQQRRQGAGAARSSEHPAAPGGSCSTRPASRQRSPDGRSTSGRSTGRSSKRDKPFEEIYDLMAMRVITDTVQNCYAALGMIHITVDSHPGAVPRLHRRRRSRTCTGRSTPRSSDPAAGATRSRSAPRRCTATAEYGIAGALALQGGRSEPEGGRVRRGPHLVPPGARMAAGNLGAGGIHGVPPDGPLPGRDLRLHPEGRA